jgi:hypothetical protein
MLQGLAGKKSGSKLPHSISIKRPSLAFMQIREYQEGDLAALRAIHGAQGFDYPLPDLRNPLFVTKLVLANDAAVSVVGAQHMSRPCRDAAPLRQPSFSEDDPVERTSRGAERTAPGKILGAAFLRLTAEAYLLLDPRAGTPCERWQWLLALHSAAERDAWQRGLEDVHAWLPASIAQKFGKRLARLGWVRDDAWTPYCKKLMQMK